MEYPSASYTCPMHPEVIRDAPGKCPKCEMNLVPVKRQDEMYEHQHNHDQHNYTTHSTVVQQHSAMHMGHEGHEAHDGFDKDAGHHTHDFLKRFWVCLAVTFPILLLSHMIPILTWTVDYNIITIPCAVFIPLSILLVAINGQTLKSSVTNNK